MSRRGGAHLTLPSLRDGPLPLSLSGGEGRQVVVTDADISLSAPGGGEGRGEVGDARALAGIPIFTILAIAILLFAASHTLAAATIAEPVAVLQGLDKITARVSEIDAPVGKKVQFGNLTILVRDCEKNPPEDRPESAAFLEIDETRPGERPVRQFSGWMFASSPALSALENPVYDVIVLGCKAASGLPEPAAGNSSGKEAR
jgi:hypothetical protein